MRILTTGVTGLLGRYLIPALQERNHEVRALVLPMENATWLQERGVTIFRGDIRDRETLLEPLRGVDKVIHLAGLMGVWRPIGDYSAVNVSGAENICWASLAAGVSRLVHVSSWTVYGMDLGRPANENFPLNPFADPYALTKADGDRVVQRFIAEQQLPAVILRPGTFFGPGDRLHFGRMADRLRAGKGIVIGRGDNALPFVYVTDVVQGILRALDHERAVGQIYNISHDQPLTQAEMLQVIARETGGHPPSIHVPYHLLYTLAFGVERAARLAAWPHQPPVTRLGVKLFGTDNRHAIDKAREEIGYTPQVSLVEGVRIAAAWYRRQQASSVVSSSPATA